MEQCSSFHGRHSSRRGGDAGNFGLPRSRREPNSISAVPDASRPSTGRLRSTPRWPAYDFFPSGERGRFTLSQSQTALCRLLSGVRYAAPPDSATPHPPTVLLTLAFAPGILWYGSFRELFCRLAGNIKTWRLWCQCQTEATDEKLLLHFSRRDCFKSVHETGPFVFRIMVTEGVCFCRATSSS